MALTPSYLQKCTDGIEGEYQKIVTDILVDMAQRIAHAGSMTSTTEYLNAKLRELSLQQEYINRALAKVLNTSESEVEKLMNESTYKSTRDTITQLEKHGYDTSGLSFGRQIEKSTNIAKNELSNLTRTTGQLATAQMMNLYDQAYLQVASGAYSYDQAVTNAIRKLAKEGLGEVTYPTGAKRSVEAAVRVAVRTSVAQNALKCEEDMLDDMDINLVEVSSHLGARPSHAVWQGKIYWRNHPEGNYENFYEATGYGTATGLGGYNCRHQFYPFFGEGDEQTYYHIDETKNEQFYQMEQQQRALERKMRKWDREEKVLKAGGQDTTEARKWKRYYKEKINDLIKSSNGFLKRDYSAEKAWSGTAKVNNPSTPNLAQHKAGSHVDITTQAIQKVQNITPKGYTQASADYATTVRRELLRVARDKNQSKEVASMIDLENLVSSGYVLGTGQEVNILADAQAFHMLATGHESSLELAHNHPGISYFSLNDIAVFLQYPAIKTMTVITNQGTTWYINKTDSFSRTKALSLLSDLSKKYKDDELVEKFLKKGNTVGIERN